MARTPERRLRRLAEPRPAEVRVGDRGPTGVDGVAVETVVEDWLVEDRWWTGEPLRRRYFEVVTAGGRRTVVFRDLVGDGWFSQRA